MAIKYRKGRKRPWMVYWRDPDTGAQRSRYFALEESAVSFNKRKKFELKRLRQGRSTVKVNDLIKQYVESLKTTKSSRQQTKYHADHLLKFFGSLRAEDLTQEDVFSFVQEQLERGLTQLTANRRVTILRAALTRALDFKIIKNNPLAGMRLPKGRARRYVPPTPSELYAMAKQAPVHVQRVIYLGYYLGVRVGPSELFSLTWQDCDFGRSQIRVWSAAKNTNQPWRDVPLNSYLLDELKKWWKADAAKYGDGELPHTIVHWHGSPVNSIARAWATTLEKAGIKRSIRPYDLRHAYATEALAAGADIKAVSNLMGHASISTVLRSYQYVKDEQKRKAVECLPKIKRLNKK